MEHHTLAPVPHDVLLRCDVRQLQSQLSHICVTLVRRGRKVFTDVAIVVFELLGAVSSVSYSDTVRDNHTQWVQFYFVLTIWGFF